MSGPSLKVKLKQKNIRIKHQKKKVFQATDPLLSVFMWGVNHSINELGHVNIPVMLMPDDFRAYSKIKVDYHLYNKENMPSHFKFKEYCPMVFRNLRERFGVDDSDYLNSLTRSQIVDFDLSGRSEGKFYQSSDRLFVIKMLSSDEVGRMHSLLKQYHPYIVERHGKTLLPQYLAMYRLTVDNAESYFVVMRNIFSNHLPLHRKYDLKGSTVDREASEKEKEKDLPTLKDNDLMKDGTKVIIGEEAKEKLVDTLTADVDFLMNLQLMDYSLLLGVHDCERYANDLREGLVTEDSPFTDEDDSCGSGGETGKGGLGPTPPESPVAPRRRYKSGQIDPDFDIYAISSLDAQAKKEVYFLAIIDILTHYGVKKQAAKAAKTVKYGANVDGISTIEPESYARRFLDFISKVIE
ncbi:phosphatidylinositol 5-phosphate 4-kinase type-2 alpha-like [Artemia franciscana]|uniref:1-phosphatidylinositol-5-phosphate 4-kinase n=1 Tax=Artemia franciscana TaxID=6661 RepID=A0AA88KT70_ARTSF|nr:hypothetical protein QYM36_015898 [Artemia franciscana]